MPTNANKIGQSLGVLVLAVALGGSACVSAPARGPASGDGGVVEGGTQAGGVDAGGMDVRVGGTIPDIIKLPKNPMLPPMVVRPPRTTGDPPATGTATCRQILECLGTCGDGDNACYQACEATGSPPARSTFGALVSCAASCADGACLRSQCGPQLQACTGTPTVTAGTASCRQIIDCFGTCASQDTSCLEACRSTGSPSGRTTLDALLACAQPCAGDAACIKQACPMQIQGCVDDGKNEQPPPVRTGTSTCDEVWTCTDNCPANDQMCFRACVAKGTAEAQATFEALVTCADSCRDDACFQEKCQAQIRACSGSATMPPPTTATCDDVWTCTDKCAETDEACFDACLAKGSAAARALFEALLTCGDSCRDDACFSQKCQAQIEACENDGKPARPPTMPTGTASCDDVWTCTDHCAETEAGCVDGCIAKGSAAAQATFKALLKCSDSCGDEACFEQKCQAQIQACVDGP
jgi:hypothetical protein